MGWSSAGSASGGRGRRGAGTRACRAGSAGRILFLEFFADEEDNRNKRQPREQPKPPIRLRFWRIEDEIFSGKYPWQGVRLVPVQLQGQFIPGSLEIVEFEGMGGVGKVDGVTYAPFGMYPVIIYDFLSVDIHSGTVIADQPKYILAGFDGFERSRVFDTKEFHPISETGEAFGPFLPGNIDLVGINRVVHRCQGIKIGQPMRRVRQEVYPTKQAIADRDAIAETACSTIGRLSGCSLTGVPAGAKQQEKAEEDDTGNRECAPVFVPPAGDWAEGRYLLGWIGRSHRGKIGR